MNVILFMLSVALIGATFSMVWLYNATVNASHNIDIAKASLDAVGANITDLNNKVVAVLGGDSVAQLTTQDGLIAESRPFYLTPGQGITRATAGN